MSVMLARYILGHWHNLPTMTPSLAHWEYMSNSLALKPGGAILGKGERERETTWWPTQGSLNNWQILIRYCDTAEQKTRLKMNQTWLLCRFARRHIERRILRKKETVSGGVGSQWAVGVRIVTPSLCCPLSTIISGLREQGAYPVSSRLDTMLFMLGPCSWPWKPRLERTAFIFSVSITDYNSSQNNDDNRTPENKKLPMI